MKTRIFNVLSDVNTRQYKRQFYKINLNGYLTYNVHIMPTNVHELFLFEFIELTLKRCVKSLFQSFGEGFESFPHEFPGDEVVLLLAAHFCEFPGCAEVGGGDAFGGHFVLGQPDGLAVAGGADDEGGASGGVHDVARAAFVAEEEGGEVAHRHELA